MAIRAQWKVDAAGKLIEGIDDLSRFFGLKFNARRGSFTHIDPRDRERVRREWRSAFLERIPYRTHYLARFGDKRKRMVSSRALPCFDQHGKFRGYIGNVRLVAAYASYQTRMLDRPGVIRGTVTDGADHIRPSKKR